MTRPESLAQRVSAYNRGRKWRHFVQGFQPGPETTVLDVGFSDREYSPSDNYLEKHYPWPKQITALGVDAPREFRKRYPAVTAVQYDGRIFPFADQSFDICWSNAVIEHVGTRDQQLLFLKEIRRVARRAYLTTPNRHFPIEVHTRTPLLHFLPKPVFDSYLNLIGKKWATGSYMRLLSSGDLRQLLADAGIERYHIRRNRMMGFTMDFVITLGP